ncbi:permease of the major facilitator superfamily [Fusarium tjaetaba]|uniref:Permease of the major facilitator superfamily n=1 Tax=Fusarium tjaetaba TaxID=1567544 RepID=A0A8H5VJR6_9HYPO|nr:permease of the major facilitator superfamily [Fusarium tjaetaba]KAF5624800.1 permease of the major facilitator superfamily [Fusarium tjaetaba]
MASTSRISVFETAPATQSTGDVDKKNPDSPTVFAPDDSTSSVRRGSIEQPYRTYKIRWFGLVVLTLLNIMVSWSWLTFSPVTSSTAKFYKVDETMVNWLSTIFVFANFAMTLVTIKLLDWGLRPTLISGSALLLIGNWIRYAGSYSSDGNKVAVVAVAQALLGMSQSLVLSAPTRFSETWFTSKGRVTATAVMSLANPTGAAVGSIVVPLWTNEPSDISSVVLYVAIIVCLNLPLFLPRPSSRSSSSQSSAVAIAGFFVPGAPATPPSAIDDTNRPKVLPSLRILIRSLECYLIIIPFWVYTGLFVATTSLINQIVTPYGFSDTEAGIGGGLLIVLGLIFSAITAPIIDRTKKFILVTKCGVVVGGLCYLALVWVPSTKEIGALYAILCCIGISSLSIVPVVLEVLTEFSYPAGAEITSTTAWAGGQLLGGCFIILGNGMKAAESADPPRNMKDFTVFQAVLAMAMIPLPLMLGMFGRSDQVALKLSSVAAHDLDYVNGETGVSINSLSRARGFNAPRSDEESRRQYCFGTRQNQIYVTDFLQSNLDILTGHSTCWLNRGIAGLRTELERNLTSTRGSDMQVPKCPINITSSGNTYLIDFPENSYHVNTLSESMLIILTSIHVAAMTLAFFIVYPIILIFSTLIALGELIERPLFKARIESWQKILFCVFFLPLLAIGLLCGLTGMGSSDHFRTEHGIIGLVTAVLATLAVGVYLIENNLRPKISISRRWRRVHMMVNYTDIFICQAVLMLSGFALPDGIDDFQVMSLCGTRHISTSLSFSVGMMVAFVWNSAMAAMTLQWWLVRRASGDKPPGKMWLLVSRVFRRNTNTCEDDE